MGLKDCEKAVIPSLRRPICLSGQSRPCRMTYGRPHSPEGPDGAAPDYRGWEAEAVRLRGAGRHAGGLTRASESAQAGWDPVMRQGEELHECRGMRGWGPECVRGSGAGGQTDGETIN